VLRTSPKINQSRESYLELSFIVQKAESRFYRKTYSYFCAQTDDERRIRSLTVPNKTTMC